MLTRIVLPRGAAMSVGRLFATSVPRWNVPTSVEGTATKDGLIAKRKEIRVQLQEIRVAARETKRKQISAQLLFRKEQAAARVVNKSTEATAALKKVKTTPWGKLGKLPSRPFQVYMAERFASGRQPNEKIGVTMKRIYSQFKELTAEQRLLYEEEAAANLKVREASDCKDQGHQDVPQRPLHQNQLQANC